MSQIMIEKIPSHNLGSLVAMLNLQNIFLEASLDNLKEK